MDLSSLILPKDLLTHFTTTELLELCDIETKEHILELHLEENNELPSGYLRSDYESKGFYPQKRIQDFPVRGKALYLCIKRRVWREKNNPSLTIKSDYSFISEGSKLTKEISDFLKGTGRDPSRYDK
tara:strand:- start:1033 stop:1413 length:381 start_codon:yes stop_codon:yes gene_type:complete